MARVQPGMLLKIFCCIFLLLTVHCWKIKLNENHLYLGEVGSNMFLLHLTPRSCVCMCRCLEQRVCFISSVFNNYCHGSSYRKLATEKREKQKVWNIGLLRYGWAHAVILYIVQTYNLFDWGALKKSLLFVNGPENSTGHSIMTAVF